MTGERWGTVAEAVGHYKKTERTIRRWVEVGRLESKDQGGQLFVKLAGEPEAGAPSAGQGEASPAAVQIAELRAQVSAQKALIEQLTSERDFLRQALASAMSSQQKLIEAGGQGAAGGRRWWWPWSKESGRQDTGSTGD